jgi:antirestriction protein ArdC
VILAPRTVTEPEKDDTGNPVKGPDGKPAKRRRVIGFTTATVFDVSQTDGKPLPHSRWNDELPGEPPDGYREDLEAAIRDAGYEVEYAETGDGSAGYTSPGSKKVVIGPGSPANQARTLAHELGHIASGHMDNIADCHSGHGGKRSQFETEADSVAYVLSRANGMPGEMLTNTGDYIAGWSGGDTELVGKTGEHVQKTVKELLAPGRFRNADQ